MVRRASLAPPKEQEGSLLPPPTEFRVWLTTRRGLPSGLYDGTNIRLAQHRHHGQMFSTLEVGRRGEVWGQNHHLMIQTRNRSRPWVLEPEKFMVAVEIGTGSLWAASPLYCFVCHRNTGLQVPSGIDPGWCGLRAEVWKCHHCSHSWELLVPA